MEILASFNAREVKRAAAEERKRPLFSCRGTVRVEVKDQLIPRRFLKIEGTSLYVVAEEWRRRDR